MAAEDTSLTAIIFCFKCFGSSNTPSETADFIFWFPTAKLEDLMFESLQFTLW